MAITSPDDLLAQVAAGLASSCDGEVIAEAAALVEVEQARVRLVDRLRTTSGPVGISASGLPLVSGFVVGVGEDLVVVHRACSGLWAISRNAISCISGLAAGLRDESPSPRIPGLTWAKFLRRLSGAQIWVHTGDGVIRSGELTVVGADFFELGEEAGTGLVIAFSALVAVQTPGRRDGLGQSPR